MTGQKQLQEEGPSYAANPLEQLNDMLASDMKEVNAVILSRMQSSVHLIPRLAAYLIAAGGKRIRPLLTLASTHICGGDMNRAYRLSAAVEFIHSATLLHDDVVDESRLRRGKDAANIIFGNQASVLVGDFLFSKSFCLMVEDGSLDVLRILSNASAVIAEGEVLQLSTAGNINTTYEDYIRVIESKTAALFAAACEVGPAIAGASLEIQEQAASFGMNLGIAFQMADDTLDYMADQQKLGKNIGDDFREGKMTAPVIYAIENATDTEKKFWYRAFSEKVQRDGDLEQAIVLLEKYDCINRTMTEARGYALKAQEALNGLPDHPYRDLLREIAAYTVNRET